MKLYKYFVLELNVTFLILSQYSPEHCIQCSDIRARFHAPTHDIILPYVQKFKKKTCKT